MNQGYISLHRTITSHWLWDDKPFDKRSAWIDLLMSANYKDRKILLGNELIDIERGSFITSEKKLMEKWGWSKTKIRSFLLLLETDEMIIKKSDSKKTTLTIVNYGLYQVSQTTEEPQKNRKRTAKEPQKDTDNKENKVNKVNKSNKEIDSLLETYTKNQELAEAVSGFMEMRRTIKKPLTDKALSLVLSKLEKIGGNDEDRIKILNNSIVNCWQGVFELKGDQKHGRNEKHGGGITEEYRDEWSSVGLEV